MQDNIKKHKINIKLMGWFNFMWDFKPYAFIQSLYFSQILDSYTLGMSIFTIMFIGNSIFEIPTGVISDKFGRKISMSLGSFLMFLALLFYIFGDSYLFFAVGAIFQSLGSTMISGTDDAIVQESIYKAQLEKEKEKIWGSVISMFHFGLTIANILAGVSLYLGKDNTDFFKILFVISLFSQLICVIIPFFMIESNQHIYDSNRGFKIFFKSIKTVLIIPRLRNLFFSEVINHGFRENIYLFEANFTSKFLSLHFIAILRGLAHFFMGIGYKISDKIINLFGYKKSIFISFFSQTFIDITAVLVNSILSPFIFMWYWFFGTPGNIAKTILIQEDFTETERATMGSVISFGENISVGIIGILVGYLGDTYGPFWAILLCAVCAKILSFPFLNKALKLID